MKVTEVFTQAALRRPPLAQLRAVLALEGILPDQYRKQLEQRLKKPIDKGRWSRMLRGLEAMPEWLRMAIAEDKDIPAKSWSKKS